MKILLTRTAKNNERTEKRLAAMGHNSVNLPLAQLTDLDKEIPNDGDGYIVTSSSVFDVLTKRKSSFDKTRPLYCVGQRTKEAAVKYGCQNVPVVAENAENLSAKLLVMLKGIQCKLTYIAGEQRAFDFAPSFKDKPIEVDPVEIYRMERLTPDSEVFTSALEAAKEGIQLHFSVLSAQHFFDLVKKYDAISLSQTMHALSISNKTAKAIDISLVKSAQNAKIANEASLLWQVEFMINQNQSKR